MGCGCGGPPPLCSGPASEASSGGFLTPRPLFGWPRTFDGCCCWRLPGLLRVHSWEPERCLINPRPLGRLTWPSARPAGERVTPIFAFCMGRWCFSCSSLNFLPKFNQAPCPALPPFPGLWPLPEQRLLVPWTPDAGHRRARCGPAACSAPPVSMRAPLQQACRPAWRAGPGLTSPLSPSLPSFRQG